MKSFLCRVLNECSLGRCHRLDGCGLGKILIRYGILRLDQVFLPIYNRFQIVIVNFCLSIVVFCKGLRHLFFYLCSGSYLTL